MTIELTKGTNNHKWKVKIDGKTIQFGAKGYTDYTLGAGDEKKRLYITRHKSRENWTKSGIHTSGFWSRWLLWNKKSIEGSLKDIKQRFGVS
jgi:hypothetical protein